jgi:hypothetical protein
LPGLLAKVARERLEVQATLVPNQVRSEFMEVTEWLPRSRVVY